MCRVGQNHIYTVCIRCFGREITIYGYIRCINTVLANPRNVSLLSSDNDGSRAILIDHVL